MSDHVINSICITEEGRAKGSEKSQEDENWVDDYVQMRPDLTAAALNRDIQATREHANAQLWAIFIQRMVDTYCDPLPALGDTDAR